MQVSSLQKNVSNKKFAIILFLVALGSLLELWYGLGLTPLLFGEEASGQITKVEINKVQTLEEHVFVHTFLNFKTLEGVEVSEEYVGDRAVFNEGPIKVKYKVSNPKTYIFTDQNSSYFKFYSQDKDGAIYMLLIFGFLILFGIFGGLKALGYDLVGKLINRQRSN